MAHDQVELLRRMPTDRAAEVARGILSMLDWRPDLRKLYSPAELAVIEHLAGQGEKRRYAKDDFDDDGGDYPRLLAGMLNAKLDADEPVTIEDMDAIAEELEGGEWCIDYSDGRWTAKREPVLKYEAISTAKELKAVLRSVDGNPTDGQKEAGNYRKGHVRWKGLDITIETAPGQYRRGTRKDGVKWKTLMKDSYGYIKRTTSDADGDPIDVFLCDDHLDSDIVFCVNQIKYPSGRFDEHKFILGQNNEEAAKAAYLRNYMPGWKGFGSITAMTIGQFKRWLEDGDSSEKIDPAKYAKEDYVLQYAAQRAPKGGVTIGGTHYRGGQWIPGEVMAKAGQGSRERVSKAATSAKDKRSKRGKPDVAAIKKRLAEHAKEKLTPAEKRTMARSLAGLKHHHGDLAAHRIEELIAHAERTYSRATGDGKKQAGRRLAMLHAMLDSVSEPVSADISKDTESEGVSADIRGFLDPPPVSADISKSPEAKPEAKEFVSRGRLHNLYGHAKAITTHAYEVSDLIRERTGGKYRATMGDSITANYHAIEGNHAESSEAHLKAADYHESQAIASRTDPSIEKMHLLAARLHRHAAAAHDEVLADQSKKPEPKQEAPVEAKPEKKTDPEPKPDPEPAKTPSVDVKALAAKLKTFEDEEMDPSDVTNGALAFEAIRRDYGEFTPDHIEDRVTEHLEQLDRLPKGAKTNRTHHRKQLALMAWMLDRYEKEKSRPASKEPDFGEALDRISYAERQREGRTRDGKTVTSPWSQLLVAAVRDAFDINDNPKARDYISSEQVWQNLKAGKYAGERMDKALTLIPRERGTMSQAQLRRVLPLLKDRDSTITPEIIRRVT